MVCSGVAWEDAGQRVSASRIGQFEKVWTEAAMCSFNQDPDHDDSRVLLWQLALLTTCSFKSLQHRYRNGKGDMLNSSACDKTSAASLNKKPCMISKRYQASQEWGNAVVPYANVGGRVDCSEPEVGLFSVWFR